MANSNDNLSRTRRNKKRRSDTILNWLIGAVVVGILIVGWSILSPNKDEQAEEPPSQQEGDLPIEDEEQASDESNEIEKPEEEMPEEDEDEEMEVTVIDDPEESFISQTVIDSTWEPIGTVQTGEHVSLYDGTSDDWKEKQEALLYATELTEDNVIYVHIGNGGNQQKSIGIVSSGDYTEKYRVFLEWIDGEGWKPTQLDILNTLDFDY